MLSESLYEGEELPKDARDHAALLASKVYYYLGEYDDALSFALGAGNAFNEESRTPGSEEYVETIVCETLYFCATNPFIQCRALITSEGD